MNVDPTQPPAHQAVHFEEPKEFHIVRNGNQRQPRQQFKDLAAWVQVAARQLADHEGMTNDLLFLKRLTNRSIASSEVIDPDRRVDKNHFTVRVDRRRLIGFSAF